MNPFLGYARRQAFLKQTWERFLSRSRYPKRLTYNGQAKRDIDRPVLPKVATQVVGGDP
jgi:hypothetical protein